MPGPAAAEPGPPPGPSRRAASPPGPPATQEAPPRRAGATSCSWSQTGRAQKRRGLVMSLGRPFHDVLRVGGVVEVGQADGHAGDADDWQAGGCAFTADQRPLPVIDVQRVGEDVDGVEADLASLPDAVGGSPPGLNPGRVDQSEFHGASSPVEAGGDAGSGCGATSTLSRGVESGVRSTWPSRLEMAGADSSPRLRRGWTGRWMVKRAPSPGLD